MDLSLSKLIHRSRMEIHLTWVVKNIVILRWFWDLGQNWWLVLRSIRSLYTWIKKIRWNKRNGKSLDMLEIWIGKNKSDHGNVNINCRIQGGNGNDIIEKWSHICRWKEGIIMPSFRVATQDRLWNNLKQHWGCHYIVILLNIITFG